MHAALLAQAEQALARRDFSAAARLAGAALAAAGGETAYIAKAQFVAGVAALETGRVGVAAARLSEAMKHAPREPRHAAQAARALALAQRIPEALAAADHALALDPADALTLDTLGVVYSRANAHERAAAVFARAIALMPDNAAYRFNLAAALTFTGDIAGAERELEACLRLDPAYWKAHSALSQLRRQTPQANHVERLRALLARATGKPEALLHLNHALAKEHEDLGDCDAAFAALVSGKAAWRAQRGYRIERDEALFDAVARRFPDPVAAHAGGTPAAPVFVVGLPRTGTTLVDRILSSHPLVRSAGELQAFPVALKRAAGSPTRELLDLDTLARSTAIDVRRLGADYLAAARPASGGAACFTDKLPHNFLYAGFIAQALPDAKIVCLRRHPLDSCLSNFRQMFALNTPYFDYALDLSDLGRYYLAFDRLIAHWRRVLPPSRFMELAYEDIVQAQEASTRRLLDFCGLPWDGACLHFERNAAPVATASAVQVRAPLHRDALSRWRRYETRLAGLRALLQRGGVAC